MTPLNSKIKKQIQYLQEIDSAIFWHWSFMSRQREAKNTVGAEYETLRQSKLALALDAKGARDHHLRRAAQLKREVKP